jgi:predicted nucleic acid-binding protein
VAFVVDNSVVIAWLVAGQATPYTRQLSVRAEREVIHAPAIWPFELVNTLWIMQRRRLMRADQADAVLAQAHRLSIIVDLEPVAARSLLDWTRRAELTSYDAAYVELAARHGWPLATCDRQLQRAAQRVGVPLA